MVEEIVAVLQVFTHLLTSSRVSTQPVVEVGTSGVEMGNSINPFMARCVWDCSAFPWMGQPAPG